MIYEYFKVSDTHESVLDLHEILKVELKDDNIPSFSTGWDETIIAMKKQADDENFEKWSYRQLQHSTVRPADTVQNGESRDHTRLNQMVVRRSVSFLVKDNLKSPPLVLQPHASLRAKEKKQCEIACNGRRKVNSLEEKCVE